MEAITYRQSVCRILWCILRQNHIYRTVIVHFQTGTVIDTVTIHRIINQEIIVPVCSH